MDTPRGQEGRPSQSLTVEQATALLRESEKSRLHAFITLSLLTGVRSEEARALTWEQVEGARRCRCAVERARPGIRYDRGNTA